MGHPTAQSSNSPTESIGLGVSRKRVKPVLGRGWAEGIKPCQKENRERGGGGMSLNS